MYLCKKLLNLSYSKIGQIFQRDHSTVISSIKNIKNKKDEKTNFDLREISKLLNV